VTKKPRIKGSGKWIKIRNTPKGKSYFYYSMRKYYLDEVLSLKNTNLFPNPSEYFKEYDGIINESAFSGVLIKLGKNDNNETAVKAYHFFS